MMKKKRKLFVRILYTRDPVVTEEKMGEKLSLFTTKKLKRKKMCRFILKKDCRMRDKMKKPESKAIYNLRKITVEPVFSHLKQNLGFREFLLKGLEKVKIEMDLVCIAKHHKRKESKVSITTLYKLDSSEPAQRFICLI